MKLALKEIETALRKINDVDLPFFAKDFLIDSPPNASQTTKTIGNQNSQGALYIQTVPQTNNPLETIQMGIFLSPTITEELNHYPKWKTSKWTLNQKRSFFVACEEISHFYYLCYHLQYGRPVSQLELEVQGEVDKFAIHYFSNRSKNNRNNYVFEEAFEDLFTSFNFTSDPHSQERKRYEEANRIAKNFIKSQKTKFKPIDSPSKALQTLRKFYRLSREDKLCP